LRNIAPMAIDPQTPSEALVRALLAAQFPHWADLPVTRVASGAANALFRLGDELTVRVPLRASAARDAEKEYRFLPRLGPHLPLPIPVPLALGSPSDAYPLSWSVVPWLTGTDAAASPGLDRLRLARDVAGFLRALQAIPTLEGPPPRTGAGRGGPLRANDALVERCLGTLAGVIDTGAAARCWADALEASVYSGPPVWLHGDLHPANLLVADGRLSAVIDWGSLSVGDPATEMMFAWLGLDPPSRALLRELLAIDDATWQRGRGWALLLLVEALARDGDANPAVAGFLSRAVSDVVAG